MIKAISNNSTLFSTTISKDKKENIEIQKVEKSKIDYIQKAIKNGDYKLDINKTASAMAKQLL
jgi:anti-sigma28 factor (negative regulator of flagellin synthesis)